MLFANGAKYSGEWRYNYLHGEGTMSGSNGTLEKGTIHNIS
jgi:hypothetical protein